MNRREFLAAAGALPLAGCADATPPLPPGGLLGADAAFGHRLLKGGFPPPIETRRCTAVIIGGGIAGLSAAWRLAKAGIDDVLLCELEPRVGGNARWGENAVSAFPWASHYLPLPTREARAVRELLADLGAIEGDPHAAKPRYDERYLCQAPQERLYRNGVWQEGLMPQAGLSATERAQMQRFIDLMASFKVRRGRDGRKAFALPLDLSSRDPELLALDRQTMRDWLRSQGIDSQSLHWYVDYACRDDYGTGSAQTSAWAGIHYFACRDGEAQEASSDIVLTAPEGNGWMVRRIEEGLRGHLLTSALCTRIGQAARRVFAEVFLSEEQRTVRIEAEQLIWAANAFVLPRVWPEAPAPLAAAARKIDYAPWLVANLTLDRLPEERHGAPLSWDNVIYDSPGLGYVVATHQHMRTKPGPTVFTYYRALADPLARAAREKLLAAPREAWADAILRELERPHPDIRTITSRMDVCRYGHAMARPLPGTLWHGSRTALSRVYGRIQLAHADLSGMSLFEEANYRGVLAAERVLKSLGVRATTIL
ncbi:MAG: FAD-dependent oxidoreductase [Betaproteobacteria bacterium]|nr:FAD-dependent oxidoreductase [Betaproteobacteria bacterium]